MGGTHRLKETSQQNAMCETSLDPWFKQTNSGII